MKHINVEQWVELFRLVGLDDDAMKKWHHLFEEKHPEGHQSFLEWLGLSPSDIERIRKKAQ